LGKRGVIVSAMHALVMPGHLTLFLACFSIYFSRKWQQNGGVLTRLPMILGLL